MTKNSARLVGSVAAVLTLAVAGGGLASAGVPGAASVAVDGAEGSIGDRWDEDDDRDEGRDRREEQRECVQREQQPPEPLCELPEDFASQQPTVWSMLRWVSPVAIR